MPCAGKRCSRWVSTKSRRWLSDAKLATSAPCTTKVSISKIVGVMIVATGAALAAAGARLGALGAGARLGVFAAGARLDGLAGGAWLGAFAAGGRLDAFAAGARLEGLGVGAWAGVFAPGAFEIRSP